MPKAFDRVMVHVEIAHHLKLRTLTDSEWKAFLLGVLPIAAKSDVRGALMVGAKPATADDVAHQARVSTRVARSALAKLSDAGMLDHDADLGADWVHDFDEWNPEPKRDSTAAQRAARYREKQKSRRVTNGTVTPSSRRDDRDDHGNVTPPEVEVEEKTPLPPHGGNEKERAKATPEIIRLCGLLAAEIRRRDDKAKVAPDSERWLREMRLLVDDRGGDTAEVERVLRWSQADAFWQQNILSPAKLRQQFTQLVQRASTPRSNGAGGLSWDEKMAKIERLQAEGRA